MFRSNFVIFDLLLDAPRTVEMAEFNDFEEYLDCEASEVNTQYPELMESMEPLRRVSYNVHIIGL